MSVVIAGIDFSMNSPAITVWDTTLEHEFKNLRFYNFGRVKKIEGTHAKGNVNVMCQEAFNNNEERFRRVAAWAKAVLISHGVTDVILEGYAMGNAARSNNLMETAECCGLLKQHLNLLNIPFEIVPPNVVKKRFTDNGAAKKPQMIEKFTSLMNYDLVKSMDIQNKELKPVDDFADSYAIMRCHSKAVELLGEVVC